MAQVFPQWLSESERANPSRRAEIVLYDKLVEQLTDSKWMIIYGAAIKWRHDYGISDRETEFVVGHPDLGIIFIEVKGGSIEREGNIWYTTPIKELRKPKVERERNPLKKSPYVQVTDSAKEYERKVLNFINTQKIKTAPLKFGTAVCFPDIEISVTENLGADALMELTLGRSDLEKLPERLKEILKIYQGKFGSAPGQEGMTILRAVLARDWHIDSFLSYQIQDAEKERKKLTDEQFVLLYEMQDNPQMLIRGCAGSGKTMLAAKKAQQLASMGQKVLLVCFNENLATWLGMSEFTHSNVLPVHFHGFVFQTVKNSKVAKLPPHPDESDPARNIYFKKTMPEALELAALEKEILFDAIIVDEGQDFEDTWFAALQSLLKDRENGVFYVFYDDNQRIYNSGNISFKWPKYRLSKNMRNTDQIFAHVQRYYHQPEIVRSSGIPGPDPVFIDLRKYESEYDAVQDILSRLVQEKIKIADVTILTPRAKEYSIWGQAKFGEGKYKVKWTLTPFKGEVACCSIYGFKGLERQVIILSELSHVYSQKHEELLYIGISRARDHLIVLGKYPS